MGNQDEIFEIRGDVADPTGGSNRRGTSVGIDLTKGAIAHPQVKFGDRISTLDLYKTDGELLIHMYCPQCTNANAISSKRKRIDWSGDRISIETFRCRWPGCGLRIAVKDNVAKVE